MNLVILLLFLAAQTAFVIVGRKTFRRSGIETGLRRVDLLAAAVTTGNVLLLLFHPTASPVGYAGSVAALAGSAVLFYWSIISVKGAHLPFIHDAGSADELVTSGAFAFVRNPFYLSYLLAYGAVIPATSSLWSIALFAAIGVFYWDAVRREEAALSTGNFAEEYASYCRSTGRFLPRLRRSRAIAARSS